MVNPCPGVHVFDLLHGNSFSSFTSHAPTSPMRRNASQHVSTKTYSECQEIFFFFCKKKMFVFFFFAILLNFFHDVIEFTFQTLIALVLSITFCARHLGTSRYAWIHPGSKIEWLERVAVAMIIFIDFFLSSVWAFSYIVYFRSVSMQRFVNACIAMQTHSVHGCRLHHSTGHVKRRLQNKQHV